MINFYSTWKENKERPIKPAGSHLKKVTCPLCKVQCKEGQGLKDHFRTVHDDSSLYNSYLKALVKDHVDLATQRLERIKVIMEAK
jgi:hypothetical protein